ncbi:hypothetical protein Y023_5138 [Burkholderia pseudomallei A79D]|nr:hypothetical protein Y023_5138 [Burkholderia pseudomallei A79D]KGX97325.1 hypothetical protein X997_4821 [Burkholderia pseudomallei A79C]
MAGAAIRRPEGGRHALQERGHAKQIGIAARHARVFERRASVEPRAARINGRLRRHALARLHQVDRHYAPSVVWFAASTAR